MKVENAIIKNTMLTPTDEGIGFVLSLQSENWNSDYSGIIKQIDGISTVILTLGVNSWEQLTGCPVRIKRNETQILNIGNFIVNKWLVSSIDDTDENNKISKKNKVSE